MVALHTYASAWLRQAGLSQNSLARAHGSGLITIYCHGLTQLVKTTGRIKTLAPMTHGPERLDNMSV
jgi:hypothetical protein